MKRSLASSLLLVAAFLFSPDDGRAELKLTQVNPAYKAGSMINDPYAANEYPWFSNDGRLFFWTKQLPGEGQELYVSYLKNWGAIKSTAHGQALPALSVAYPRRHDKLANCLAGIDWNQPWCDLSPLEAPNAKLTFKSLAYCQKTTQPVNNEYRFTLFFSAKDLNTTGAAHMYRADDVWVKIDGNSEIVGMGIDGNIRPAIPQTTTGGGSIANETEPMLTRDGKYLFWTSNAFTAKGTYAKYIYRDLPCTQLNQTPTLYSSLPASQFKWRDQYISTPSTTAQKTAKTNYHTVLEQPGFTESALIFEQCAGQVDCDDNNPDPGNRDCQCKPQNNKLSTSGFAANGKPYIICNGTITGTESGGQLNPTNQRTTHPAIAGPKGNHGWVLFYMRQKNIWYTKIDLVDNPSGCL